MVGLQGLHRYGLEGDSGPSTPHSVTTQGGYDLDYVREIELKRERIRNRAHHTGGGGGEHVIRLAPNPWFSAAGRSEEGGWGGALS